MVLCTACRAVHICPCTVRAYMYTVRAQSVRIYDEPCAVRAYFMKSVQVRAYPCTSVHDPCSFYGVRAVSMASVHILWSPCIFYQVRARPCMSVQGRAYACRLCKYAWIYLRFCSRSWMNLSVLYQYTPQTTYMVVIMTYTYHMNHSMTWLIVQYWIIFSCSCSMTQGRTV